MTIKNMKNKKPFIDLNGPQGNAFFLLGTAKRYYKEIGKSKEETDKLLEEMTNCDYENLLKVFDREFGKYVDLYR